MDKLSVMRAFCRIVELNSFTKAAADLGLSPALLSRETKRLEESLGCALLIRTTRKMTLTEHGALYYAEALRLLAQMEGLENAVRQGAGMVKGRLRVNAPLSFGLAALSPLLPRFMAAHPDLTIELNLDDRVVDMVEGGFDLSIRVRAELPDSGLIARNLGVVRQRLFASRAYLDARGRPSRPADLHAHMAVGFSLADHGRTWSLRGPEGETEIAVTPKLLVSNSLFLRDVLIAGQGVGALPHFLIDPASAAALERVLPNHELPERRIFAVTANRLAADAKTRAFLDFLQQNLPASD